MTTTTDIAHVVEAEFERMSRLGNDSQWCESLYDVAIAAPWIVAPTVWFPGRRAVLRRWAERGHTQD